MSVRIAIDTGGTFTDLVLSDPDTGRLVFHKVPSTPDDPSRALVEGVRELVAQSGYARADVRFLIHGTTVATNTILQRKGARTAFITTEGFRDVLHIQRQDRPHLYNMRIRRTPALVPRSLRFELPERTLHDGSEALPVDRDRLKELIETLRMEGIEAVGVGLLHSHIDPGHERSVGDVLRHALPETTVCLSSDMSREEGEYERFSTCVMNAYVQPVMTNYLNRVNDALSDAAVEATGLRNSTLDTLQQPNLREFGFDDLFIERLHDVLVGASLHRLANVRHIVLGRAEHDDHAVAAVALTQLAQEIDAVHDGHVPVEQHDVRHGPEAVVQRFLAIHRFFGLKVELFENPSGHHSDDFRVINNETGLHLETPGRIVLHNAYSTEAAGAHAKRL